MEDHSQKCSNSSSGCGGSSIGRSTKKAKQKKVPQRGLGVAQLEKIRIEEQQKKDGSSSQSSFLSVTLPNFHQTNQPSSSIPFPPPPPIDLPNSPNPLFRNIDGSTTVPLPNSAGWPPIPSPGHVSVPKIWTSLDYNLEKESFGPPYESNPMWHFQGLTPRSQPFQDHCSMVEPPSNQSFYSNYRPMWPDDEKMVGTKRPYPFSMENTSGPLFNCKLPTIAHPNSDEPASCGNGGAFTLEPSHPIFREVPSCSSSMSQLNSNKINGNAGFGGDFLTLGPPTTMTHAPKCELPDFDSLPYQGSTEGAVFRSSGSSGWNQQPAFYSFLPLGKVQASQGTTSINCCKGELGESIDLNLKL